MPTLKFRLQVLVLWPPDGLIVPIELHGLGGVEIPFNVTICNLGEDAPGRLGLFHVLTCPPSTASRNPRIDSLSNLASGRLP